MPRTMSRRQFLISSGVVGGVALAAGAGTITLRDLFAAGKHTPLEVGKKILVFVTLYGGNDGLNTVIPYTDKAYYAGRPELAYDESEVLPLADGLGLNPSMTGLKRSMTPGSWRSCAASAIRTPTAATSGRWRSGRPRRLTRPKPTGWLGPLARRERRRPAARRQRRPGVAADARRSALRGGGRAVDRRCRAARRHVRQRTACPRHARRRAARRWCSGSRSRVPTCSGSPPTFGPHACGHEGAAARTSRPGNSTSSRAASRPMRRPASTACSSAGSTSTPTRRRLRARCSASWMRRCLAFLTTMPTAAWAGRRCGALLRIRSAGSGERQPGHRPWDGGEHLRCGRRRQRWDVRRPTEPDRPHLDDLKYNVDFRSVYATLLGRRALRRRGSGAGRQEVPPARLPLTRRQRRPELPDQSRVNGRRVAVALLGRSRRGVLDPPDGRDEYPREQERGSARTASLEAAGRL